MVLGNLISGFIVIIVGVNLMPTIADQVRGVLDVNGTNISGASATLLDLTILFFALSIMASAIGIAISGLRESGLV